MPLRIAAGTIRDLAVVNSVQIRGEAAESERWNARRAFRASEAVAEVHAACRCCRRGSPQPRPLESATSTRLRLCARSQGITL